MKGIFYKVHPQKEEEKAVSSKNRGRGGTQSIKGDGIGGRVDQVDFGSESEVFKIKNLSR